MAKNKGGRPKKSEQLGIDLSSTQELERLKTYCQLGLTQEEIAKIYMVSLRTFKDIFKEQLGHEYKSFRPFYNKHKTELNMSFRRNLVKQSNNGNTQATIKGLEITGTLTEYQKRMIELKERELDINRDVADKDTTITIVNDIPPCK